MILKQLCHFALYALLICSIMPSATAERNLPDLGDRSSGIISLELEREIGKDFLRQLRRSAPYISDPLLQDLSLIHI